MKITIEELTTRDEKRKFLDFVYKLYTKNPAFVDIQVRLLKNFLFQEDSFTRECSIQVVQLQVDSVPRVQAMLIFHPKCPVMQVAFFDALPNAHSAVEVFLEYTGEQARQKDYSSIVFGLHGHVSYAVGFLENRFHEKISFDSYYSLLYYQDYFKIAAEKLGLEKQGLTTFQFNIARALVPRRLMQKINHQYTFRHLDMNHFKRDILLFGDLCNQTLENTYLYFKRSPQAMYELMKDMKFFLRPENLIFAMQDGREIGFFFWHPDYNEIFPAGRKLSLLELGLRYLLFNNRIQRVKVNCIGVLREYQNTGVILGLIHNAVLSALGRYEVGETNFVWDNNLNSQLLNRKLTETPWRVYSVYVWNL